MPEMPRLPKGSDFKSRAEAAAFIAEVVDQLKTLAHQRGLDALAYFLQMTHTTAVRNAEAGEDRDPGSG